MEKKKLSRKEMKGAAKKVLKKHYWVLVVLCLILAFFNVEFASSLDVIESTSDTEELEQLLSDDGVAEDLDQRYGVSDGTSFYDFIYSAVNKGLPETIRAIQQKEQELRDSSAIHGLTVRPNDASKIMLSSLRAALRIDDVVTNSF